MNRWHEYKVFSEVNSDDICGNIINARWVLKTKNDGNIKARLVIKGFEDEEKATVICESPTARRESTKILLALMPTLKFRPKMLDISCAFLQGNAITRDIFIYPPVEANRPTNTIWKLQKCVYGLGEASRQWYNKLLETFIEAKFVRSRSDPALFVYYENNKVDDFLYFINN